MGFVFQSLKGIAHLERRNTKGRRGVLGLSADHRRFAVESLEHRTLLDGVSFAAGIAYPTGSYSCGIVSGDFNNDRKPDLAAVNGDSNTLSVLLNNGNGAFAAKTAYATGSPSTGDGGGPFGVATGDFNGDGALDIVTANGSVNSVSVFRNNGNGTFASHVDYRSGGKAADVIVGDFNGDGMLDLAVANGNSNTLSVLFGNGDGTFAAHVDYPTGIGPWRLAAGDFNGDGHLDLVVANCGGSTLSGNTVSVLLNKGDGTFAAKTNYTTGSGPLGVTIGDFNGNGIPDLAVANYGGNSVSVLLGKGDGTFAAKTDYAAGIQPYDLTSGDFNGDGRRDLAVADFGGNKVSVLLGGGTGAFSAPVVLASGQHPASIATGDFNNDGKLDLASGNGIDDSVNVFLNQSTTDGWVTDPPLQAARDQFAAGVINGKVYVFGGNAFPTGSNLKSTEVFNPATNTWSYLADNNDNSYGNGGAEELTGAVVNGKFYVFGAWGGIGPSGLYGDFNFNEVYNPATNLWTSVASKPTLVTAAPCAVYSGEIYVFGGGYHAPVSGQETHYNIVEAYNPGTNKWRTVTHMPQTVSNEALAVVGNSAYLIGGVTFDASGNPGGLLSGITRYDFLTNTWVTTGLAPMPLGRGGTYDAAAPVVNGKIYVISGGTGIIGKIVNGRPTNVWLLDGVNVYDPVANTWSIGPTLPAPRDSNGAVAVGNTLYVIGGNTGLSTDSNGEDGGGIMNTVWSWQVPPAQAQPDLSWNSLSGTPSSIPAGGALTAARNYAVGGSAIAGNFNIQYRLSTDGIWGNADDILFAQYDSIALAGGKSLGNHAGSIALTIPLTAKTGAYYLLAKLDSTATVAESNENNNVIVGNRINVVPPANDAFANRLALAGAAVTASSTNANATKEAGEPAHAGYAGGHSVWWTWTAPISGRVTIDTAGSGFKTLLGVYVGSKVSALSTIVSNKDLGSSVAFDAVQGRAYQIAVDGHLGAVGNIKLIVSAGVLDEKQAVIAPSVGWRELSGGYQGKVLYTGPGSGANTATWTFSNLAAGTYSVSATWLNLVAGATNAPFKIYDGSTLLGTVLVNQKLGPSGTTFDGAVWQALKSFKISSGSLVIKLSNYANGYVVADGVRIEKIG